MKVVPELVHALLRKLPKEFKFELLGLLQCTSQDGINKKVTEYAKFSRQKWMNALTHVLCEFGNWVGVHVLVSGWMCESASEGVSRNGFCREAWETVEQNKERLRVVVLLWDREKLLRERGWKVASEFSSYRGLRLWESLLWWRRLRIVSFSTSWSNGGRRWDEFTFYHNSRWVTSTTLHQE